MNKTTKKSGPRIGFMGPKFLGVFFFIFFISLFSCVKEDKLFFYRNSDQLSLMGKGIIPINLFRYNQNVFAITTKSLEIQSDTMWSVCIDSLITIEGFRQVRYDDGWIYEEFPFKSNEAGLYGALVADHTKYEDSLANIKCYFMRVCRIGEEPILSEYVVTMIPTKSYSVQNPDYDYITKPSFSGVILYSDMRGNLLRCEYIISGQIRRCRLSERENINSSTDNSSATATKSGEITYCSDCGQELDSDGICWNCLGFDLSEIVVIGINNDTLREFLWLKIHGLNLSLLDYQTGNYEGGGIPPDPGYGGGIIQNNKTYYTVSVLSSGCHQTVIYQDDIVEGSPTPYIEIPKKYSDSCWFKALNMMGNAGSNVSFSGNYLQIHNVQSTMSFVASYTFNDACTRLALLSENENIPEAVRKLLAKQFIQRSFPDDSLREYAVLRIAGSSSDIVIKGGHHSVPVPVSVNRVYHFHLHPEGSIGMTSADFAAMCNDFSSRANSPLDFTYGIVTASNVLIVRLRDQATFNTFIQEKSYGTLTRNLRHFFDDMFDSSKYTSDFNRAQRIREVLEGIGLEVFFGETRVYDNTTDTLSLDIGWKNLDYDYVQSFDCNRMIIQ